ncbi:dipeptidyl aminopeptidase [Imleria badia]|nr:dipeptidyl aminopeptidase [Imleria badia]
MPNPAYERISDNDGDEYFVDIPAQPSRVRSDPELVVRPHIYYGDGPFDPPSSEDEDEGHFLDKSERRGVLDPDGFRDSEPGNGLRVGGGKRPAALRYLIYSLASLVFLSACIGVFAATNFYHGKPYRASRESKVSLDHMLNGTFSKHIRDLHWVPEAGDGVFSTIQNGQIQLIDLKTNITTPLVSFTDIKDNGQVIPWTSWKLSPDMKYILVKANHHKQWRHSSFGNYYVHNLETKVTYPLLPPTNPPVTAYATWSPTGESIAFVASNDLYILPTPSASTSSIRVTTSGNASLFHGVPDWIYEEEVLSQDYALWWSPDSSKIAFLRLDETAVEEYRFPIYNPTEDSYAVIPYTEDVVIKYPKPGYNNPLVSVHVFDLEAYLSQPEPAPVSAAHEAVVDLRWSDSFPSNNSVINQVAWVDNSTLVLKEVTRAADHGNVVLFDLDTASSGGIATGEVVRKLGIDGEEGDEGWIDAGQNIYPVPASLRFGDSPAYLDIVPTQDGYNHIALFDPATSSTPRFLTSGTWEVTDGIQAVDAQRGLIYFQAAHSSIERHLYSVPISSPEADSVVPPVLLTDDSTPSFYSASFSPGAGFYLLDYGGPNVPWQRVVDVSRPDFDYVLTDNAALNTTLGEFEAATITYSTIDSDGYELNVKEMRPPKMDDSGRTKYPVLFYVYGGPESQKVNVEYKRDWHDYLVCTLQYIVVVVDGRGTGFKGRRLRNPVRYNMGFWETQDQINAARIWAGKDYVDPKRIGIWGWSYGGFMASKVAEANAGIHSLSMAIAPVTSWRLYDSIYTERYMGLPDDNPGGYINASISHVEGFKNIDFLFAHGSGDDNVHFAHSAHLLDMFTEAQVQNFRFRMFTDRSPACSFVPSLIADDLPARSDHSIVRRGANKEVYEYMALFLLEKWGKGGRRRGW